MWNQGQGQGSNMDPLYRTVVQVQSDQGTLPAIGYPGYPAPQVVQKGHKSKIVSAETRRRRKICSIVAGIVITLLLIAVLIWLAFTLSARGCNSENGGCHHICVEERDGWDQRCQCFNGFVLDSDQQNCLDPCNEPDAGPDTICAITGDCDCSPFYDPVCASIEYGDKRSYLNGCQAECEGYTEYEAGNCDEPDDKEDGQI